MPEALCINNCQCLKCDAINKEMIKVGEVVLCSDCFKVEFVESGEYTEDNDWNIDHKCETYQAWLSAYKKYIEVLMKDEEV